jgi:hypothetical protein
VVARATRPQRETIWQPTVLRITPSAPIVGGGTGPEPRTAPTIVTPSRPGAGGWGAFGLSSMTATGVVGGTTGAGGPGSGGAGESVPFDSFSSEPGGVGSVAEGSVGSVGAGGDGFVVGSELFDGSLGVSAGSVGVLGPSVVSSEGSEGVADGSVALVSLGPSSGRTLGVSVASVGVSEGSGVPVVSDGVTSEEAGAGESSARAVATNAEAQTNATTRATAHPRTPGDASRSDRGCCLLRSTAQLPSSTLLSRSVCSLSGRSSIATCEPRRKRASAR